ncbi:hypothetical protein BKA56DRAFT_618366 [Ilyonectria sp. MPI-CAGE-AT-0026]|nr:hypothetical protein BKA56DRAFT_618366 [Ilyonectria sp. MPI-CAGE-AT-0026]
MLSECFFPLKRIWLLNRLRFLLNFFAPLYHSVLFRYVPRALLQRFAWLCCVDPLNPNIPGCCNRLLEKQLRAAEKPAQPTFPRPNARTAEKQAPSPFSLPFFLYCSDGPCNQFPLPPTPFSYPTWYTKTKPNLAPATLCLQVLHAQHEAPFYVRSLFGYASPLLPWTAGKSTATWVTIANICCGAQYSPSPQTTGQRDPLGPKKAGVSRKGQKGNGKRRAISSVNNNKNPGDSDDEGSGDERGQSNDDAADNDTRFWACLYYASDPHNHFRCLGKYKLRRFADIMQHLERCHRLPPFYCPKCWHKQTNKAARDSHIRNCSSPNLPQPERLYDDKLDQLKDMLKGPRGRTDEEKWFAMWDVIFPGRPRPRSPYVEQGMAEPAGVLRRNNEPALHAEMPRLLGRLGAQPSPQDMAAFVASVVSIAFQVPSREPQHVDLSLIGDQASLTRPSRGLPSEYAPLNIPAVSLTHSHSQSLAGNQFPYDNQPWYNPPADQWTILAGPLMSGLPPADPFATNPTSDLENSLSLSQSDNLIWPELDLSGNFESQNDEFPSLLANPPHLQMTGPFRNGNSNATLETPSGETQAPSLAIRPHDTVHMSELMINANPAEPIPALLNLAPGSTSNVPPRSTKQRGNRNDQYPSTRTGGAASG